MSLVSSAGGADWFGVDSVETGCTSVWSIDEYIRWT